MGFGSFLPNQLHDEYQVFLFSISKIDGEIGRLKTNLGRVKPKEREDHKQEEGQEPW